MAIPGKQNGAFSACHGTARKRVVWTLRHCFISRGGFRKGETFPIIVDGIEYEAMCHVAMPSGSEGQWRAVTAGFQCSKIHETHHNALLC